MSYIDTATAKNSKTVLCVCMRAFVFHSTHVEGKRQLVVVRSLLLPRSVCMYLCLCGCTHLRGCSEARYRHHVCCPDYHSPFSSFETGSLTEPGARLVRERGPYPQKMFSVESLTACLPLGHRGFPAHLGVVPAIAVAVNTGKQGLNIWRSRGNNS